MCIDLSDEDSADSVDPEVRKVLEEPLPVPSTAKGVCLYLTITHHLIFDTFLKILHHIHMQPIPLIHSAT